MERPFLAAKGSNTNLAQFLMPNFPCAILCTISYMHGRAPKTVLHAYNLVYEKSGLVLRKLLHVRSLQASSRLLSIWHVTVMFDSRHVVNFQIRNQSE